MDTKIFRHGEIAQAAAAIKRGELVAFPTETVYGLGADATNEKAVKNVYLAKGRPSDNPLIVHVNSIAMVEKYAAEIPDNARKLMDAFWPGSLTIILKIKKGALSKTVTGGLKTVAFRYPDCQPTLDLIEEAGVPMVGPSANTSGKPSPTTAQHVYHDLHGKIAGIVDNGPTRVGVESTVLDMSTDHPVILRPGAVTKKDIEAVIGSIDLNHHKVGKNETPKAPGMKYKHYAPKAEMIIYKGDREKAALAMAEEKLRRVECGQKVEIIIYDDAEPEKAAREFFAKLRACDKAGVDVILAAALKEDGVGFAVMNRMFKSAGYNIVEI